MATTTIKLDWDEQMLNDQRIALLMLRRGSNNAVRRQRLTRMIDDIDGYRNAVAAVRAGDSDALPEAS